MLPENIIEEDEEKKLIRDSCGVISLLWKKHVGAPLQQETLIKTETDFEEYKNLMRASESRFSSINNIKNNYEEDFAG